MVPSAAASALFGLWLLTAGPPWCRAHDLELNGQETLELNATMPAFNVDQDDTYLCTSVALPDSEPLQLIGFQPLSSKEVVHHMLLFGRPSSHLKLCQHFPRMLLAKYGDLHQRSSALHGHLPSGSQGAQGSSLLQAIKICMLGLSSWCMPMPGPSFVAAAGHVQLLCRCQLLMSWSKFIPCMTQQFTSDSLATNALPVHSLHRNQELGQIPYFRYTSQHTLDRLYIQIPSESCRNAFTDGSVGGCMPHVGAPCSKQ